MFIGYIPRGVRADLVATQHPISARILRNYDDEALIVGFHSLLEEIELQGPTFTASLMRLTVQNIVNVVFEIHGGRAFLQLGQHQQSFLLQMQQQHSLKLPQQNFLINQQPQQAIENRQQVASLPMIGQDMITRQQAAPVPAQQQGSSAPDKNEIFLDRFNKDNERNEKMKNRYADELALKARAELEAEEKKAIETEKENARKLMEAEERLKKTRIENDKKEDTVLRTDEAISRADELKRQVREMAERAEQEKLDSERRIAERRREAAARREQDRQRPIDDSRHRKSEWNRSQSGYETSHMQRSFSDRTSERGYGEREPRGGRDIRENNRRFDEEDKEQHDYKQRLLLENERFQTPSSAPPKYILPDTDDSDSDSDEDKRQDPYELIGLPDRERTPIKDIETTQRVLNRIHQNAIENAISEATRRNAEKRLVEIRWAADILLNEMNKRAFDEAGAIYPHEQQAWRKKNGIDGAGGGKYIPG